ncbi:prepilin-type N-terminal cleavage/methylation domain-containing protein [Planctomycetales bacterium ZRK34]|nr:prepilin-type N-terminal cleavage/methylation domain-containing protein [Planctomycetales bacterium ZRK34]
MRTPPRAFTLIELLVVVAIIALLIGILLPSLSAARNLSRQVACQAHLRGAGQAMAVYGAENKQYLAGPLTSGAKLTSNAYTFSNSPREPTFNMDWISPTLGDSLGLPGDRDERIKAIFNDAFRCPSNAAVYDYEYDGGYNTPPQELSIASYSSPLGFHVSAFDKPSRMPVLPSNNAPRKIDNVGRSISEKVWAMDGVRYVRYSNGSISYNTFVFQDEGGNFMTHSPAFPNYETGGEGNPYRRDTTGILYPEAEEFAYRHVDQSLNVVMFDGHTENLLEVQSRDATYYFPSKTFVKTTALAGMPPGYATSNDNKYPPNSYIR